MSRKILQWFGALALLVLGLGGLAAWGLVGRQVSVTIADRQPASDEPDALAVLRDDVRTLAADLQGLTQVLEKNFAGLVSAIESERGERDRRAERAARRLDELTSRLAALTERLRALETSPPPVEPSPAVAEAAPTPAPEPEPSPAAGDAPQASRGFLSFKLPSAGFDPAAAHRFEILPSLSRVGFDGKSTLHDFTGVTSQVEGSMTLRLAGTGECSGRFSVGAASLDTGLDERDTDMREILSTGKHPRITFDLLGLDDYAYRAAEKRASGTARGKIEIRGVTREVRFPVAFELDSGKRLVVEAQFPLKLTDFGISPPSQLGVIKMEDEVQAWISVRARATAKVDGER